MTTEEDRSHMNEAETITKIVEPLLKTLGTDYTSMKLENSFKIRLGKFTIALDWKEYAKQGRYDILITVDGKNLFIVEAKKEGHEIVDDDIEQARSYAKLIDPIAPFVMLTNGKTNRIFETISKKELTGKNLSESEYAKNNFTINIDDEARQLALMSLFSLNYKNFLTFCNKQNSDTLSRLTDEENHNTNLKKHIPDIFVKRNLVNKTFYNFLDSDATGFLITGKSGIGKTNTMCNLVTETQQRYPVLFYNAGQLSNKLENEIESDLLWEFPSDKSVEQFFKQINDICNKQNTKLILFIDAIDEWFSDTSSIDISRFVGFIKGKNIKIILSCKNSKINDFLSINGSPSQLSQNLYVTDKEKYEKFVNISNFTSDELVEAIEKYSKFFKLTGFIPNSNTYDACKDPFLLRVISEVYAGKDVPAVLNSVQIYEKYLEMLETKINNSGFTLTATLIEICKIILSKNSFQIYENDLYGINEKSFNFLKEYGVLIQQKDNSGSNVISFAFDGLRNYVVVYQLMHLDNKNSSELKNLINVDNDVEIELIKWYKNIASSKHEIIISQIIENIDKHKAEIFLNGFTTKMKELPFIKKRLFSKGHAGLLVLYDEKRNFVFRFGYKNCLDDEEYITWLNTDQWKGNSTNLQVLMTQYNVTQLRYMGLNFTNLSVDDCTLRETLYLTKELIKKRLLDESHNVTLSLEKFFASFRHWSEILSYPSITYDTESTILPIDIPKLLETIEKRGFHYNEYQYGEKPRSSVFTVLHEALHNLSLNIKEIKNTALPHCDDPTYPSHYVKPSPEYFTKQGLVNYVRVFFQKYLEEYKILVEINFPELKDKFPLYQKFPFYLISQLHNSDRSSKADGLMYAIFKNTDNQNELEIRDYDEEEVKIDHFDDRPDEITTRKGIMKTEEWVIGMDLFALFLPTNSVLSKCPLTAYVYDQIEEDLEAVYGSDYSGMPYFS